jgi:hypothetical protein
VSPSESEPLLLLRQLASAIQDETFREAPNLRALILPQYETSLGQRYKFCVQVFEGSFEVQRIHLFYVYLPENGYPAIIEVQGDGRKSCPDSGSFTAELLRLIQESTVQNLLRGLCILATPKTSESL